ncbi:PhzF family phenazine biosynthesis protein [Dactylosporangium sp. NPDC000244]|uniref:PhzF family phenazine biosynthesis protein n=1 Tax=Dactylosporangium sp. NPDC000244 TaxID=3154365 RepID=UPI00331CCAE0
MYDYVIADVFTDTALEGNPLAVVPDAAGLSAECMQRIAREMNLSETTFVFPPVGGGDVRVRIFTPVGELPFAGHPTFGTAVVLAATGHPSVRDGGLRMETGMGVVPFRFTGCEPNNDGGLRERARCSDGMSASRCDDGMETGTGREPRAQRAIAARMRQPIPVWEPYARAGELLAALGVRESTLPVEVYRNGPRHAFVGLDSVEALSALRVDLRALAAHEDLAANCFAPTDDPLVWRARMFSPAYGVTEDAGTGSAAGPLALHLGRHGLVPLGGAITVRQGVEMGRPSTIRAQVSMLGDRVERVEIAGSAVVVADGRLHI